MDITHHRNLWPRRPQLSGRQRWRAAVVVDPQRDIDRVLAWPRTRGDDHARAGDPCPQRLRHRRLGAGAHCGRRVRGARRQTTSRTTACRSPTATSSTPGRMRLRVMHTPGHTHHHVSYVLRDADGRRSRGVHRRVDAPRRHRPHRSARRRAHRGARPTRSTGRCGAWPLSCPPTRRCSRPTGSAASARPPRPAVTPPPSPTSRPTQPGADPGRAGTMSTACSPDWTPTRPTTPTWVS